MLSFRGGAKRRTRNLEIPGLVLAHHPGMTIPDSYSSPAPRAHLYLAPSTSTGSSVE